MVGKGCDEAKLNVVSETPLSIETPLKLHLW